MVPRFLTATLCAGLFSGAAPPPACDMTGYHSQPGLEASSQNGSLSVRWDGEKGQELLAGFAVVDGTPTVRELAARRKGGAWGTVGRDLVPEFTLTTGVRRTGHGLSYENRWDVFWDAPLNSAKEVRRFQASYHADRCEVRTDGARLEISFPGLRMGRFSGDLRFTIYRGTNLLRLEAYADKIRDTDYFTSGNWLGSAFKALPVDLSQKRLGELRCFGTLDDMNNWGGPKYMVGEVDTYKKFADYDLYGDFNVNYVRLDRMPGSDDWSPVCRALRSGEFFVTTGEVLIPHWGIEGSGKERTVVADQEWTFPLEFVEAVWGDGEHVDRKVISAADQPPFGSLRFRIPFEAAGKKWVRFSVWDSAGNGAFTQPVHLK